MSSLQRLVLWNVDHTLVDVGRVIREAYAEAFQRTVGRPLVRLAPTPGRSESEIIFETLAFNDVDTTDEHLPAFMNALSQAFAARRQDVRTYGRVLPGAREAVTAFARTAGVVQSVVTGSIRDNALLKLAEFGLDVYLDVEIGGYDSAVYTKAALIEMVRTRAVDKYGGPFPQAATVLLADSPRDVQAARISGAAVVAVATGSATEAELRSAGADVVLPTLAETQNVLRAVDRLVRSRS